MNTTLKHWKEAATLILAAGRRLAADTLPSRGPLTAASGSAPDSGRGRARLTLGFFDYDVLMLKRSGKSGFMPNAYVFPGGLVDASDFSSEWLDVFKQFSDSPNFGLRSVKQRAETRPPMFATDRLKLGSPVPGDVAFRICALRETFEESGVLLVVPAGNALSEVTQVAPRLHSNANDLSSTELSRWRTLVNQDPCNFIRMCRELRVLPNIWALHEWSNWLTPVGRSGAKRFDTAFFICCLQEIPQALQDEKEIVQVQVKNAERIYCYSAKNNIPTFCASKPVIFSEPKMYILQQQKSNLRFSPARYFRKIKKKKDCLKVTNFSTKLFPVSNVPSVCSVF